MPTIRHWLKIGLLAPAQVTPAGYQLFSHVAIERCRRIQSLKGRRLMLTEIRDRSTTQTTRMMPNKA